MEPIYLVVLIYSVTFLEAQETQPPNIIFVLADDLGWNDVSFHGSPEIPTPNIDALAMSGIALHNYYGEWMCTPSRAAFLTGKYPSRLGLQHFVLKGGEASALPLSEITMAQHLKLLGYDTHLVGKWHLGYQTTNHTPTKRGFDSFFGYYTGKIDHYDFTNYCVTDLPDTPHFYGIDLHNGTNLVTNIRGEYASYIFAKQAKNIILNHNSSRPLFLFFSELLVHVGHNFQPFQAPPKEVAKFKYIKNLNRRIHAGMLSVLDDTVGIVFDALHRRDMLKNSLVMFVSDNGGETSASGRGVSSNYPLRGQKQTYWEGGTRLPAVIWSPLLKLDRPRVSRQLMHISDWLPTLYSAAGGNPANLGNIDGKDLWQSITEDLPSPRTTMLQNLDPVYGTSAFRKGDLKVVNGTPEELLDQWYGPSGFENVARPQSMYQHVFRNGSCVRDVLVEEGWWMVNISDGWYEDNRISCATPLSSARCSPDVKPCLFNITADPCEYVDLADMYPEIVQEMLESIESYRKVSMQPQSKTSDPRGDPLCHGFAYVPWMDPDTRTACDYLERTPEISTMEPETETLGFASRETACAVVIFLLNAFVYLNYYNLLSLS